MKKRNVFAIILVALFLISCTLTEDLRSVVEGTSTPTATRRVNTPTSTLLPTSGPAITVNGDITQLDAVLINLYQKVSSGIVSLVVDTDNGWVAGSGFVYDGDGHILTSYHVVDAANTIEVDFPSGLKVSAALQAYDPISDLAVLKVDVPADQLHPLEMGETDSLNIGQMVVAIGAPFNLNGSMTLGIVSAKGRMLESVAGNGNRESTFAGDIIQTDAAINPGNSGGPLFNLKGQVVGINRAISTANYTSSGEASNSGVGFAVSANIINKVVPVLISEGEYQYPYIGIFSSPGDLTLDEWQALGLDRTSGVYVLSVDYNGPADKAGIRGGTRSTGIYGLKSGGDLILAIDGIQVLSYSDMISYLMSKKSPGEQVTLQILRSGRMMDVVVILGARS